MVISDICIKRPVFASVLSLMLVLIGVISYQRLAVREYPNIDPPVVNVNTSYLGASAEIIETQVTQVLEDSLSGIEGIDYISSISRPENSLITIRFTLKRDSEASASDVRDRVSRARDRLPTGINEPLIKKVEADAQPILYLAFSSTEHNALEITDYADRHIKDRLQTLNGVAEVLILGGRLYSMRLWLDPARLAGYGLTPQDVETALRQQNVEIPSGRIESVKREFTVLSETDMKTPEQFNDLIIRREKGYLVRLKDIGHAELAAEDERRIVRFNGEDAVALGVVKQATANPLEVSRAVREDLPQLIASLPAGMMVKVAYDKSVFIEKSIENVYIAIAESVGLVILIIFLFLRSWRGTLIPLITIPVSMLGSFAVMHIFGFSVNTLTLLAMVLAIGLVVDDAIVMLENIYRHIEEGMTPIAAAFKGSKEIGFAVVAMTLTLAAVYAPVGFMTGIMGRLFTEFAWTLAAAVLVSGVVALTLSPMMCSRMLKRQTHHNAFYMAGERRLTAVINGYRRLLTFMLKARSLAMLIGACVAAAGGLLFFVLPSELAPSEDQGTIVGVGIAPEGATIGYTDTYARQFESLFKKIPEVDRYFIVVGRPTVNRIMSFVRLAPWEKRQRRQQEIAHDLGPALAGIAGVAAFPTNPPPLGQSASDKPINFIIMTSRSYGEMELMVDRFMDELANNPNIINVDSDLKLNQPQIKVKVDREKTADLGLQVDAIGRVLETMFGGRKVTRFKREGKQYEVIVQVAGIDRSNPDDLTRVYVRGREGEMVQLSNVASVIETVAPRELNHFNQMRSTSITASTAPGYTLGQALDYMNQAAARAMPEAVKIDYAGQSRDFRETSAGIYLIFVLALAFIYLVLAAQFESFIDPFIIMLTVPLSITGGLLALWLSGGTLNIYSQVGLITLIGLITKHGILIVEFANQLQEKGHDRMAAVIEAAVLRLRPILMTTGAMALGAVPLAYAHGAGAESRRAVGWVIVGGLLGGTFFTLFVIPAVYTYLARRHAPPPPVV